MAMLRSRESGNRSKSRSGENGKTKRERRVLTLNCIESIERTKNIKCLERREEEKSKVKRDVDCFC